MEDEIEKAVKKFLSRYTKALENGNFEEAKNVSKEFRAFLEGLSVVEPRPAIQLFGKYAIIFSYMLDWLTFLSEEIARLKAKLKEK
jgi:hypothetical protein